MAAAKKPSFDKSVYQREYMARRAAAGRDITIRRCEDPARRARLLADPVEFLKGYFPEQFYRPFSDDQVEAIHTIVECATMGSDELICAPRGDWKTETTKHMVVYLIAKQIWRFPVLIGATADAAGLNFDHIKKQLTSELFAADFPEIADPIIEVAKSPQKAKRQTYQGRSTDLVWGAKHVSLPVIHEIPGTRRTYWTKQQEIPGTGRPSPFGGVKLTYRGLEANIRGINIEGDRPDGAVGDDLETRESANSDLQIASRREVVDKDVGGLAGDGEILPRILIGTIQNHRCLTNQLRIEWGGKRYQAVKVWPTNARGKQLWDEYVETRKEEKRKGSKTYPLSHAIYTENFEIMNEGVVLGNPHNYSRKKRKDGTPVELHGIQRVYNLIADRGQTYVDTELQNDPPKEQDVESLGLTYSKVMTRVSGTKQKELPPETQFVTAAMDLGKYACHWSITAWLDGMTGVTINYGVAEVQSIGTQSDQVHVDLSIRRTLHQWREELIRGEHCDELPANVLIDSGTPILGSRTGHGEHANVVYGFIKEVQDGTSTFKASKGVSPYRSYKETPNQQIVGNHWHATAQGDHDVWLYNLDTDWLKSMIHQMLVTPTFDEAQQFRPMTLSMFSAMDKFGKPDTRRHLSFAKHQVAEEFRQKFIEGKGLKRWWHKLSANNHWFDCSYMNLAAAIMLGMWMPLDNEPPEEPPAEAPQPKRKTERSPRRYNHRGDSFLAKRD